MTYKIATTDHSVGTLFRRIATDQVGSAIDALRDMPEDDPDEAVHDARKRIKKLRALLRLVRSSFPGYQTENRYLRDNTRLVADYRDAVAVLEALDGIEPAAREAGVDLTEARKDLVERRRLLLTDPETWDRFTTLLTALETVRSALPDWTLEADGWEAMEPGLMLTYKRARKGLKRALDEPNGETLHEWRKRVKYHRYHARLLSPTWPGFFDVHQRAAKQLARILGDRHDLDVLDAHLEELSLPDKDRKAMSSLLSDERDRLEAIALPLGQRLLADKPKALVGRWQTWWELRDAQAA
ncbi:CHAD domain-containing protein [Pelagovum pacificum]|nr:CHAD domain-containing protein [Pelagovum pacificum]QQA42227.1 CHAD domain-containing protein [Pelagovum pacificum]